MRSEALRAITINVLRVLAVIAAIGPLAYAVWHTVPLFTGQGILRNSVLLPMPLSAFTFGALLLWFGLLGSDPIQRRRFAGAMLGGLALGVLGFLGGFFGPLVVMPEANTGPLIGFIFTGPLGFILGCIVGAWFSELREREMRLPS